MNDLTGVYPPLPTPFTEDDQINEPVLREIINWLIEQGVDGVVALGSMGEFAALTESERRCVTEICLDEARGRAKVIVGTSAQSTRETIRYSRDAEGDGADGIMVVAPWYGFPAERELERHYREVAQAVNIPIVVYNNAFATGEDIPPQLLAKLAESEENIRYCKETTYDAARINQILVRTDKLTIICGTDALRLPSYIAGAKGLITATALIAPAICVELHRLAMKEEWKQARAVNSRLVPFANFLEAGQFLTLAKAAVIEAGFPVGSPRLPFTAPDEDELQKLREVMTSLWEPAA